MGVPARIVKRNGKRVKPDCDLDQIHIPDPVAQELCKQLARIEKLEKQFKEMNKEEIKRIVTNASTVKRANSDKN